MATAAQSPGYKLPSNSSLPVTGGHGCDRLHFSPDRVGSVALEDGSRIDLPLGTRMVVSKPRRENGDWYAEIEGRRYVSATGETREAAFLAALAKAA